MKMTLDAFRLSNEYLGIMRFDCVRFFLFVCFLLTNWKSWFACDQSDKLK